MCLPERQGLKKPENVQQYSTFHHIRNKQPVLFWQMNAVDLSGFLVHRMDCWLRRRNMCRRWCQTKQQLIQQQDNQETEPRLLAAGFSSVSAGLLNVCERLGSYCQTFQRDFSAAFEKTQPLEGKKKTFFTSTETHQSTFSPGRSHFPDRPHYRVRQKKHSPSF